MNNFTFLTREGCVNTTIMRERLDEAVKGAKLQVTYEVVDLDKLSETDFRRGYPTPSVLYDNADLFGFPKPTPPFPDPT